MFEATLYRMVIFFLILTVGYAVAKRGIVRKESMDDFAGIITSVLLPVLTFYNTTISGTRELVLSNWSVLVFAAVFYLVMPLLLNFTGRALRLSESRRRIFVLCFTFGNTGFVGAPLLAALFPDYGLLFLAVFSIVDQAVFWTYGVSLSAGRQHFHLKSLVSPNTVALALALLFIFLEVPIPDIVNDTLEVIANATSAMCMIYLGALCFFSPWTHVLRNKEVYLGITLKMIAVPIIVGHIAVALALPQNMAECMVIIASLPVMTAVPMIVSQHGTASDYAYATGITVTTLVVSVITIPLVQLVAFF